jgi:hypothetical protein
MARGSMPRSESLSVPELPDPCQGKLGNHGGSVSSRDRQAGCERQVGCESEEDGGKTCCSHSTIEWAEIFQTHGKSK